MKRRWWSMVFAVALPMLMALVSVAEEQPAAAKHDGHCDTCGSCDCVRKVCVPTMTEKTITKVCWGYKCEDFCIPGPSVCCGKQCHRDDCGSWWHFLWKPTCAEVRTKHVPVKHEVKRKVPKVEWNIEERCDACRAAHKPEPDCGVEE
jgi:hypothetical protein